jgi:LCP family protein required for cell wall assembly
MNNQIQEDSSRPKQTKKRLALWIVLALLLAGLTFGAVYAFRILASPASLFAETLVTPKPEATLLAPAFPITTRVPTAAVLTPAPAYDSKELPPSSAVSKTTSGSVTVTTATPSSDDTSTAMPDGATPTPGTTSKNRLSILLMGIDAYENGGTTSGTMPHTDVMIVIAIDFAENAVDLITLPRDIMTTAPGHYGYYKLNGVFNVGLGGWKRPTGKSDELADGFLLTCRAAEEWLGGISIPYYYGLDFQAVTDIVDAIGGIDYDVDQPFHAFKSRRSYHKGMQHLDGDAVMGYLRIRNEADGLDSSRTARQRRMMVAIFKKLKNEGKLSHISSLITAANSGIYTNTTLSQTTALANYATKVDGSNIQTRSMFGEIGAVEYDWRYVYVDQQNRIDLIREVYGIEAEPVGTCTRQYERWLHTVGFSAMKYMRQAEKVLARVQEMKDAGNPFSEEQIALYSECYLAYSDLKEGFDTATDTLSAQYAACPWREKKNANRSKWTDEYLDKDKELVALEQEIKTNILSLKGALKNSTSALAESIGYGKLSWNVPVDWFKDPDINEVIVNFR